MTAWETNYRDQPRPSPTLGSLSTQIHLQKPNRALSKPTNSSELELTLPHQSTVSACTHSFGFVCNWNLKFCSDLSAEHIRFWHSPYAKTCNLSNNLTYHNNHPPALFARTHAESTPPENWKFWVTWVPNSKILAPPNLKTYNPSKKNLAYPTNPSSLCLRTLIVGCTRNCSFEWLCVPDIRFWHPPNPQSLQSLKVTHHTTLIQMPNTQKLECWVTWVPNTRV